MKIRWYLLPLLLLTACLASRDDSSQGTEATDVAAPLKAKIDAYDLAGNEPLSERAPEEYPGLHHVFRLSEHIISGAEPHGEEALGKIAAMGVKTLISVDGKAPDAEGAARLGMRYVHVPIHYSGISKDEMLRIAKSFRELEGPFYVHCYHGKHRGPAAAAVGRLILDGIPRGQALAEMRQWCGTSQKYSGLYEAIAEDGIPSAEECGAYEWDFSPAQELAGFRTAMVAIARHSDELKAAAGRDWASDPEHPDVDALNSAEKLADLLARSAALPELEERASDFKGWMRDSLLESRKLVGELQEVRAGVAGSGRRATEAMTQLQRSCSACHAAYRDH